MIGIAIIALPSGIITAGYMDELRNRKRDKHKNNKETEGDKK
jgi:voltage-gated potassium channel